MEQDQQHKIIAYLEGQLSSADAEAFKVELAKDKDLQLMYEQYRLITNAVRLDSDRALKAKLQAWEGEGNRTTDHHSKPSAGVQRYIMAAIALLVLIAMAFYFLRPEPAQDEPEFMAHYTAPASDVFRGEGDSSKDLDGDKYNDALIYHAKGAYTEAIALYKSIRPASPKYDQAVLLTVDAHIQMNQDQQAYETCIAFLTDADLADPTKRRLDFTSALLQLELGQLEKGRSALERINTSPDHPFAAKAGTVLSGMSN